MKPLDLVTKYRNYQFLFDAAKDLESIQPDDVVGREWIADTLIQLKERITALWLQISPEVFGDDS